MKNLKKFTGDCLPTFFINLYKKNFLGKAAKMFLPGSSKTNCASKYVQPFLPPSVLLKHTVLQSHCYKLIRIPIHVLSPPPHLFTLFLNLI